MYSCRAVLDGIQYLYDLEQITVFEGSCGSIFLLCKHKPWSAQVSYLSVFVSIAPCKKLCAQYNLLIWDWKKFRKKLFSFQRAKQRSMNI